VHSPLGRLTALLLVGAAGCLAVTSSGIAAAGIAPAVAAGPHATAADGQPAVQRPAGAHPARPRPVPAAVAGHAAAGGGVVGRRGAADSASKGAASRVALPAASRAASRAGHRAQARWLPTGTGMWIHQWPRTEGGSAAAVVRRARSSGLSTLYVRTGTNRRGFDGGPMLRALVPAAHRAGVRIVAWDFPTLARPYADARRLARAAWVTSHGHRADAVAPDIETPAEGTRLTGARVATYLRALRRALPRGVAILATVPWPSESRIRSYPYRVQAPLVDAFVPMAYWYNRSPAAVTHTSVAYLRRYRLPVLPVGQGYDGRIDAPWLPAGHPHRELAAFFRTAHREHVQAVSLWSWQTAGRPQWQALGSVRHTFG
jgi:hypothetical protein